MAGKVKPKRDLMGEFDASSSPASKINLVIGIVVGLLVIASAVFNAGKFSAAVDDVSKKVDTTASALSAKVDAASKDAQNKVDLLSGEVKGANALTQAKQDALTKTVETNQAEQLQFRTDTRSLFGKLFDSQQALSNQLNQERVDRLTEAVKKK